jgi:cobalt/nickel transport system permease protein
MGVDIASAETCAGMRGFSNWTEIGRMDALGRLDTPIHRLDARAKIISTLAYIFFVMSFPRHEISALTPLVMYPAMLIVFGQIPLCDIAKKIALAAPIAFFVGIFNPFLDRTPVLAIGPLDISGGWLSFISIMLRFVLTTAAALALVACTGMYRLGRGLEQLGVPRVFIMQLLFLYRYLFVAADEGLTMLRSIQARCPNMRELSLRIYGALTGHLLLRSMDRATRVHRAMIIRGFDGRIRLLSPTPFTRTDAFFILACLLFFVAARTWNIAEGLGTFLVHLVT